MDYKKQKDYYKSSYLNGIDLWTHLPTKMHGGKLVEKLNKDSLILDLGSGRGLIAKNLAEQGFRLIGIDFEKDIVEKSNAEVKNWGLEGKLKFVEADVFDIPFTDASFDGIYDFGLLQSLYKEDWAAYAAEVNRVLKPGGYYLNVSMSRKTKIFFDFSPINSPNGEFEKFDMHYHFFEKEEINNIFKNEMTLLSDNVEFLEQPRAVALLETFFQKRMENK
jgi:ubiquinone/menaquinone biosynthesis C-methylase UbiE